MSSADKYDRQLRLWGAAGQKALGDTKVILIRATAAGTETLKNLILPGIGRFVVVDDVVLTSTATTAHPNNKDYASNFFVSMQASSNGNDDLIVTRAQVACQHLQELNPDVQGTFQHVPNLAQTDVKALLTLQTSTNTNLLVVASDVEPPLVRSLMEACFALQIPFLRVHSYGLLGVVQIQSPLRPLLRPQASHGDIPDLRLVQPFPALIALAQSISWLDLDSTAHAHVPYPLILLHVMNQWKSMTSGNGAGQQLPRTTEERQEFVKLIQQSSRNYDNELNFQEAVQNAYLAYTEPRKVDVDHLTKLQDMLASNNSNNHACQELHAMLVALQHFLQEHGRPPIHGTIPDMTASTDIYVQLQQVYRDQAAADVQAMRQSLQQHPAVSVSDDNLLAFCQNVTQQIDVYDTGKLAMFQSSTAAGATADPIPDSILEELVDAAMDPYEVPEQTPLVWYLAYQACQAFYNDNGRYPGCMTAEHIVVDCEQDATLLQAYFPPVCQAYPTLAETDLIKQTLLTTTASQTCMSRRIALECTRWANAELHTIGSIVGGVASQEAVKLITGQFVPLNNTYVYNGICSVGAVYKL